MSLTRTFALLLLSWITATAQPPAEAPLAPPNPQPVPAEAVQPPGVPIPGVNEVPAGAPGNPAAPDNPAVPAVPARPVAPVAVGKRIDPAVLAKTLIVEDIIEPTLTGANLASLYRKYTGRRVIVSAAAATAEFSFVQDASPQDPLTYAEAAELLKKAAIIEQFVFVPHPQDPNLDILTLSSGGIRPPGIGLDIYNENSELPETDDVITYVMTFDYIKPAEAVNTFTQIIGQFGAFGSIAAVPNASAVVITENTSLIRKLIDLKKEIDKPGSVQATRFIKVQYADVTDIATTLTELLTAQQTTQQTAAVQRAQTPSAPAAPGAPAAAPAPQAGGTSGGGAEAPPVQIVAEPRTNRIFAMGRPVDLIFVEGLVREFDIPSSEKTFLRRKLKFLTVSEFLPIAGDAIDRAFSGTGDGGASAAGGGGRPATQGQNNRQPTNNASNRSSRNSGSSGFGGSSSGFGGSGGGGGFGGGGGSTGSALSDPSVNSAPESLLVGRTLLVADNITNSIVAQGPPSALEIVERLLDQIDVKADQVMISTVFGQLSLTDGIETGMDYIVRSGDIVGRGGGGLFPALPILDDNTPANVFNPGSLPSGAGLRVYGQVGDLNIYLRAFQENSNFTVLSRPSIYTANNQKGTISSGRRIAVPTNSFNSGSTGQSTNIEYRDVVLKLEVIPLVNSKDEITLQIALVSDDVIGSQAIEGIGDVPIIGTREILTTVTVPNNQTVILGGLITTNNEETTSGIPILSSIPGIGRLFSSKSNSEERDELMVFIQPSIVNSDRALNDVQADMDSRYKVSGDARNFADGPGVLPAVGEIPQVDPVGKNATRVTTKSITETTHSNSIVKPSLRPPHRR